MRRQNNNNDKWREPPPIEFLTSSGSRKGLGPRLIFRPNCVDFCVAGVPPLSQGLDDGSPPPPPLSIIENIRDICEKIQIQSTKGLCNNYQGG